MPPLTASMTQPRPGSANQPFLLLRVFRVFIELLLLLITLLWPQLAMPQGSFLHQDEEDRNQNQDMDRGCNHSSNHWRGNWLHHIGANTARPQDWNEAGQNCADRHQLWPEPVYSAFNRGLLNVH